MFTMKLQLGVHQNASLSISPLGWTPIQWPHLCKMWKTLGCFRFSVCVGKILIWFFNSFSCKFFKVHEWKIFGVIVCTTRCDPASLSLIIQTRSKFRWSLDPSNWRSCLPEYLMNSQWKPLEENILTTVTLLDDCSFSMLREFVLDLSFRVTSDYREFGITLICDATLVTVKSVSRTAYCVPSFSLNRPMLNFNLGFMIAEFIFLCKFVLNSNPRSFAQGGWFCTTEKSVRILGDAD